MAVSGRHVVGGIMKGIDEMTPALLRKVNRVAGSIKTNVNANVKGPVVPSKRQGPGDGRQVVFNVYTQEIRPEYHAQQLGQLMASTF